MDMSIIIPAYNEAGNLEALVSEVARTTAMLPVCEIIVVDDCSNDGSQGILAALQKEFPQLRLLQHAQRGGQSAALWTGALRARGELIVTLDGDGQNDPADIAALFNVYQERGGANGHTLVAGQRKRRHDSFVRRLSSRVANTARAAMLNDGVRDTGCSLKLFRRQDFVALPFFNHLHRFIPALMKARGAEILLIEVGHRPRLHGLSKYGLWDRLWVGIADLFGVRWLLSRLKPLTESTER